MRNGLWSLIPSPRHHHRNIKFVSEQLGNYSPGQPMHQGAYNNNKEKLHMAIGIVQKVKIFVFPAKE